MSKPDLGLYVGKKIIGFTHGKEEWEWAIQLEGGVEIRNKDRREVFPADTQGIDSILGYHLGALSLSPKDTTLHFMGPGAAKVTISFSPTKYVIHDPRHGGEVWPQWDEYLESQGIPSMEGEPVSDEPSEEWPKEETRLLQEQQHRAQITAEEWLKEDAK